MKPGPHIDYKQLRRINPEAARHAVIGYLKGNGPDQSGKPPAPLASTAQSSTTS